MTQDRARKQAIRRRMEQTDEKYTEARRGLLGARAASDSTATLVDASEVARMLGTSRQQVVALAAAEADFPPSIADVEGGRCRWDRPAVEQWAAAQQDFSWGWSRPKLSGPGDFTERMSQIMDIAGRESNALNHDFIGDVHLLLALLHPDCPGAARRALDSCGLGLDDVRRSVANELGTPETPPRHGRLLDQATHGLLEQAKLRALELRDEEVSSEHVLLALADADASRARPFLTRGGVQPGELAECVIELTENADGAARGPVGDTVAEQRIHAAEVARVLGISRARVMELSGSGDFPVSEMGTTGYRRWSRRAVIEWAAGNPARGPLRKHRKATSAARLAPRLDEVFQIAVEEAEQLNHGWVSADHLLLAVFHRNSPGLGRSALASFGVSIERLREAWIDSMGDPFDPTNGPPVVPPRTHHLLERAQLTAAELEDDEILSEHVLVALTAEWSASQIARLAGIAVTSVHQRLLSVTDGMLPAPKPSLPRNRPEPSPRRIPRPPEPELAPSPLGHDPRRRLPWGSGVFSTTDGKIFKQGTALRQYRIDRDGYPVLTTTGEPIHSLIDDDGRDILDQDGNPIDGVIEIPPGAHMRAYPKS